MAIPLPIKIGQCISQTCKYCKWWLPNNVDASITPQEYGQCHRFPPVLQPARASISEIHLAACGEEIVFPQTYFSDWCGEFQPKQP